MITKLRIANFYSIGQELELDFTKGGKTQESGYFNLKDEKISLLNGFYGANASGKSNVLKAIHTIFHIIYNIKVPQIGFKEATLVSSNFHQEFKNKPTKLGFDFILKNNYYKYDIHIINGNKIIEERLFVINTSIKSGKPKQVFVRENEIIKFGAEFKDHEAYFLAIKVPEYQTLMSHLISRGASAVSDFIQFRDSKLYFAKTDEIDAILSSGINILNHALRMNVFQKDKKTEMIEVTKEVMSRFDNTIEDIDINTDNNNVSVKIKHKGFYEKVDIMQESAGTRELFLYIYDILNVFKNGGVVIYDEINRYFHPEIEGILISLFKNKDINSTNAQLFFASHNHDTLDLLNLDQIFIVEKEKHDSGIYKVSDIEDIKNRDNLKKKYGIGVLGGTPDAVGFQHMLKQFI